MNLSNLLQVILLLIINSAAEDVNIDPRGYVVYCPCMGRFGNQADHFLGALAFAKGLDRTLVLPPWIEYPRWAAGSDQIPFDRYFKVEPLQEFHRVITMEKFMEKLAPKIWPPGQRTVFCYMARPGGEKSCNAKEGNPFGPFWDKFNIDFDKSEFYGPLNYDTNDPETARKWNAKYPVDKFPVLAFTGAPASFPVVKENVHLHKYLQWSDYIEDKANKFIQETIPQKPLLGIHLRNGIDWKNACDHAEEIPKMFASPQCLGYNNEHGDITAELCFPSEKSVIIQVKKMVKKMKAKALFIATDESPMIQQLSTALKKLKIPMVTRYPEGDPHTDLAILAKADHYIGNCVSTFSAFAKRERDVTGKKSSFWNFPLKKEKPHDEL